ncbi:MAG: nitroreductase family protein [Halieaceae bacterium]|jgi:nitroreductase|nr:nitroreductase family protein [Halieaceae bacterium]
MTEPSLPLYEAMSTLRAVRRLREDPIPDDVLRRILQAATWAPSGGNLQPWRLVVVREAELKRELGVLYKPLWERYAAGHRKGLEGLEGEALAKQERMLAAADHLGNNLGLAPVILVACFNPKLMAITDAELDRPSVVGGGSVYPALQNLMLACVNEGVGCTMTTLLCYAEEEVRALLEIPGGWYTCGFIPLGYPVGKGHGPISRRPIEKMCFGDRFGDPLQP